MPNTTHSTPRTLTDAATLACYLALGNLTAHAQTDWRRLPLPQVRYAAAFAIDPGTGVGVLQGGIGPEASLRSTTGMA